jgi:hypothetical protein
MFPISDHSGAAILCQDIVAAFIVTNSNSINKVIMYAINRVGYPERNSDTARSDHLKLEDADP